MMLADRDRYAVATQAQGVWAPAGLSGGAAASSQSPNMKPPSGKSNSAPARDSKAANQLVMLPH